MLTCIDDRFTLVLNPDSGAFKGAHRDRVFEVRDGDDVLGIRQKSGEPVTAESLAAVLPDQGALLAQVQALTDQLAAATAERDAAVSAKETAESAKSGLEAQIAALNAQLHPTDANGKAVLSAVQVRIALLQAGITSAMVDATIEAIADLVQRETARTYWEYATQMHRDHPLIAAFAAGLGLADEQVDAMWSAAAAIK